MMKITHLYVGTCVGGTVIKTCVLLLASWAVDWELLSLFSHVKVHLLNSERVLHSGQLKSCSEFSEWT